MTIYASCIKCRREISTANSAKHASKCFQTGTYLVWNAGKTVVNNPEIAESLVAGGKAFSSKVKAGFRPKIADWIKEPEQRLEKSKWRKELHRTNPEAHPNRRLANNRSRMNYPERIIFDLLTELGLPFEHQKRIEGYYPDFVIGNQIIEIDGKYWHSDEKDKVRDENLRAKGYNVERFVVGPKLVDRVKEFLAKKKST